MKRPSDVKPVRKGNRGLEVKEGGGTFFNSFYLKRKQLTATPRI